MKQREEIIRRYFNMWIEKNGAGLDEVFTEDALYIESWGSAYHGLSLIKHWFEEWTSRGQVFNWDIKQYFHSENQTVAEWYFYCEDSGVEADMDGVSIIEWTSDNKIKYLKEFACELENYNPYE